MLLGHPIVELFQQNNALLNPNNGSDVIAIANTYIVFYNVYICSDYDNSNRYWDIFLQKWFGISKEKRNKGEYAGFV